MVKKMIELSKIVSSVRKLVKREVFRSDEFSKFSGAKRNAERGMEETVKEGGRKKLAKFTVHGFAKRGE